MKIRIISILFIALSLTGIFCLSVSAAKIKPYWVNTSSITCRLMFSGRTGYISASVDGQTGTSRIEGTVTVYRQSGTYWIYVDSWDKNVNSRYISITGVFTGASGVTYKAVITADVIKGRLSESVTAVSNTAVCP